MDSQIRWLFWGRSFEIVLMKNNESADRYSFMIRGGAQIGFTMYSRPLAKLAVTTEKLTISTSVFGMLGKTYSFMKAQILSIEEYSNFFHVPAGVRIIHSVSGYPGLIVFLYDPKPVLEILSAAGFCRGPRTPLTA